MLANITPTTAMMVVSIVAMLVVAVVCVKSQGKNKQ